MSPRPRVPLGHLARTWMAPVLAIALLCAVLLGWAHAIGSRAEPTVAQVPAGQAWTSPGGATFRLVNLVVTDDVLDHDAVLLGKQDTHLRPVSGATWVAAVFQVDGARETGASCEVELLGSGDRSWSTNQGLTTATASLPGHVDAASACFQVHGQGELVVVYQVAVPDAAGLRGVRINAFDLDGQHLAELARP